MKLLDGKKVSTQLKQEIAVGALEVVKALGRKPHLVAILVGSDEASETYVASKIRNCEEVGFASTLYRYDASVSEAKLLAKIDEINKDTRIDGLLVQLPLPKHISADKVNEQIDPEKDVDGFHPINLGRIQRDLSAYIPATPRGILLMLAAYQIETAGKHCVVIGRSQIVGLPMSILMARDAYPGNCTVTLCHSKTVDLKATSLQADILIVAVGKKHFVTADMVKPGAIVIDVGMNREISNTTKSGYKLYGDVDFEQVAPKCEWITPVPGGVGLMTIVGLLKNTLAAASLNVLKYRAAN